jgi:hypothetical protein
MDKINNHLRIMMLAHIAIFTMLILGAVLYFIDIRKSHKDKEYERFMIFLEHYDQIVDSRNECFKRIYYAWSDDNNFRSEKLKNFNSMNFLFWRLSKGQPELAAIENELLILEIQCISYMSKLCEIAMNNPRAYEIIRMKESYELYFYNSKFSTINEFYESQRHILKLEELDQDIIKAVFEGKLHSN